jgi:hypothetical protein
VCRVGGWHFISAVSITAALVVACSETNEAYPPPVSLCRPGLTPMTSPVRGPCSPLVSGPICLGDQLVACFHGAEGDCYQPTHQCAPGTCLPPGAGDRYTADHCADCEEIRTEYTHVLANEYRALAESGGVGIAPGTYNYANQCEPDDCTTIAPGHCELGLGPCWYLGKPIPRLDVLASAYASLGCSGPVTCDCPAQVVNAACEMNPEGYRVWGGPFSHACVVQ